MSLRLVCFLVLYPFSPFPTAFFLPFALSLSCLTLCPALPPLLQFAYHWKNFYNGRPLRVRLGPPARDAARVSGLTTQAVPSWDADRRRQKVPGWRSRPGPAPRRRLHQVVGHTAPGWWAARPGRPCPPLRQLPVRRRRHAAPRHPRDRADGKPAADALPGQGPVHDRPARRRSQPLRLFLLFCVSRRPPVVGGASAPAGVAGDPARLGKILDVPGPSPIRIPHGGEGAGAHRTIDLHDRRLWAHDAGRASPRVRPPSRGSRLGLQRPRQLAVQTPAYAPAGAWELRPPVSAQPGLRRTVDRLPEFPSASATPGGRRSDRRAASCSSDGHLGVLVGFERPRRPGRQRPGGQGDGPPAAFRRTLPAGELENVGLGAIRRHRYCLPARLAHPWATDTSMSRVSAVAGRAASMAAYPRRRTPATPPTARIP